MIPSFSTLGSGPVLLMLHGIGGGHLAFAPQVERFAHAGYRAVAWDAPGYGRSAPIEPYTFKGLAAKCIALIEALIAAQKSKKVVLLGHSMGGMVAQEVAARRPELVAALVLCGTSASFGRKPDGTASPTWASNFVASRTAPLDAGKTMAELAEVLVPQMVGPGSMPEGALLATQVMASVPAATYRKALECLVTFDRQAALANIAVPTLWVAGEFDKNATPSSMQSLQRSVSGSEYAEIKGAGHLMNLEAPDEFEAEVLAFLERHRRLAG